MTVQIETLESRNLLSVSVGPKVTIASGNAQGAQVVVTSAKSYAVGYYDGKTHNVRTFSAAGAQLTSRSRTYADADDYEPSVARLIAGGKGGYAVVSKGIDENEAGVDGPHFFSYDAQGRLLNVTSIDALNTSSVGVAADAAGNAVVIDGYEFGLQSTLYRFNSKGQLTSSGAASYPISDQGGIALASDGTVWVQGASENASTDITTRVSRYSKKNALMSTVLLTSHEEFSYRDSGLHLPIATGPNGTAYIAVPSQKEVASDPLNERQDVTILRFNKNGQPDAKVVTVLNMSSRDFTKFESLRLAVDPAGTVMLAYNTFNYDPNSGEVRTRGRTFSADLSTTQPEFDIAVQSSPEIAPDGVSIAALTKGRFIATWIENGSVVTSTIAASNPKPGKGQANTGGGLIKSGPGSSNSSLPFRSGWYYNVAYRQPSGNVGPSSSNAFVYIESAGNTATVTKVWIPTNDELQVASDNDEVISTLGIGTALGHLRAEDFNAAPLTSLPVVWAPGTTFTVFSKHPQQPGFRAKGQLAAIDNGTTIGNTVEEEREGPAVFKVAPKASGGPGSTSLRSNIGFFNSGVNNNFPLSDQIIYFVSSNATATWSMTLYSLSAPPPNTSTKLPAFR